jgi:pimeloyl-ACP methyl ester carboxylesterase
MRVRISLPALTAVIVAALVWLSPGTGAHELSPSPSVWGLVMLHGKQGSPSTYDILGGALKANGATVATPLMAFGRSRMYDATFEHEAEIVDAAIDDLRARGFRNVALAGHSHGASTALTYAGLRRRRLDALIIMAPAPTGAGPEIGLEEQRAIRLIGEGQGDATTIFLDNNSGRTTVTNFYVTATPRIYLEWNTRRAKVWVDRAKAAMVPRGLPVLWIDGLRDASIARQRAAAMGLPKNPMTRYVELDTYHPDVPNESVSQVIEWFASLYR